jgi:hypothetical protein
MHGWLIMSFKVSKTCICGIFRKYFVFHCFCGSESIQDILGTFKMALKRRLASSGVSQKVKEELFSILTNFEANIGSSRAPEMGLVFDLRPSGSQ